MSKIFLACPMYDLRVHIGTATGLLSIPTRQRQYHFEPFGSSLLDVNCSEAWAAALNRRAEGFTWFAMLHADVHPANWWCDVLIGEAEKYGADLVSALSPIKGEQGLSSAAIDTPGGKYGYFCRLTQSQIWQPQFPETFGINEAAAALEALPEPLGIRNVPREALLVNTGCFVCRLDRPWCEKVWFDCHVRMERRDDRFVVRHRPEDYVFTKRVAEKGGKVMATRILPLVHYGIKGFRSTDIWGQPRDTSH